MQTIRNFRCGNQLLAALPTIEWARFQAHMERVPLARGTVLHEAGMPLQHVYFPESGVVSLVSAMKDGALAELAVVGSEGMVGICAIMGGGVAHSSALVQSEGHGLRMPAGAIAELSRQSPAIMQPLLRYTQTLFVHMGQTSACNRHHALEQQLCRWLLQNLDRHAGNQLRITQERIAGLLGVRREGVTGGAFKLQKAGLIQYVRGRISVLDRRGLEKRSCECYAIVRRAYECLLGDSKDWSSQRSAAAAG